MVECAGGRRRAKEDDGEEDGVEGKLDDFLPLDAKGSRGGIGVDELEDDDWEAEDSCEEEDVDDIGVIVNFGMDFSFVSPVLKETVLDLLFSAAASSKEEVL